MHYHIQAFDSKKGQRDPTVNVFLCDVIAAAGGHFVTKSYHSSAMSANRRDDVTKKQI